MVKLNYFPSNFIQKNIISLMKATKEKIIWCKKSQCSLYFKTFERIQMEWFIIKEIKVSYSVEITTNNDLMMYMI